MTEIVLVSGADDTLWPNEPYYSDARAAFLAFLSDAFKESGRRPSNRVAIERLYAIDSELYPEWGVRRGRIAAAMLQVYEEMLAYLKGILSTEQFQDILQKRDAHRATIEEIGDEPFNFQDLTWFEGAREALGALKRDPRFTLCLLTSYDEEVWPERAQFLGVSEYFDFDRVLAVPGRKSAEDFIRVSGWNKKSTDTLFYAMGNGPGDILPALEISGQWRGIHIPFGLEAPIVRDGDEKSDDDPYTPPRIDDPRVITLSRIEELRNVDFKNCQLKDPS